MKKNNLISALIIITLTSYSLKGQDIIITKIGVNADTVIERTPRIRDSVDIPTLLSTDTVSFYKIRDLFINCMNTVKPRAKYILYITFYFEVDEKGNFTIEDKFLYSRILSKQLSSFDKSRLLDFIPKKWNPATLQKDGKSIKFEGHIRLDFNKKLMVISFLDRESEYLLPEAIIKR